MFHAGLHLFFLVALTFSLNLMETWRHGDMEAELMASHVRDCRCWNGSRNLCRILDDGRGEARL